jgi:hypothetical protein
MKMKEDGEMFDKRKAVVTKMIMIKIPKKKAGDKYEKTSRQ